MTSNYFSFYLYLSNGSNRPPEVLRAGRRLKVALRTIHIATLRKAKQRHAGCVLRLETCYMDNLQRLRAMVSDYRT